MREVDRLYPFDEDSELRLLHPERHPDGPFAVADPNRLRGVRSRSLAQICWDGLCRLQESERSGEAARRRAARKAEKAREEMASLRRTARGCLDGTFGKDAKAIANRLLRGADGKLSLKDRVSLIQVDEALAQLRAEKAKQGSRVGGQE